MIEVTLFSEIAEVFVLAAIECLDELLSSLIAFGNDKGWSVFISRVPWMLFYTVIKLPLDFLLARVNRHAVLVDACQDFYGFKVIYISLIVCSAHPCPWIQFYSCIVADMRDLDSVHPVPRPHHDSPHLWRHKLFPYLRIGQSCLCSRLESHVLIAFEYASDIPGSVMDHDREPSPAHL